MTRTAVKSRKRNRRVAEQKLLGARQLLWTRMHLAFGDGDGLRMLKGKNETHCLEEVEVGVLELELPLQLVVTAAMDPLHWTEQQLSATPWLQERLLVSYVESSIGWLQYVQS